MVEIFLSFDRLMMDGGEVIAEGKMDYFQLIMLSYSSKETFHLVSKSMHNHVCLLMIRWYYQCGACLLSRHQRQYHCIEIKLWMHS